MRKIVGRRSRMWHSVMLITIMIRAIFGVKSGMLLAGIAHPLGRQLLHPKSVSNHPKAHQHARQIVGKLSSHHGSTPTQQSPDACLLGSNKRRDLHIANYPPSQWKHMPSPSLQREILSVVAIGGTPQAPSPPVSSCRCWFVLSLRILGSVVQQPSDDLQKSSIGKCNSKGTRTKHKWVQTR